MEHEEVQNGIDDPILETMEDGEGYNCGRGEIETTAISSPPPLDEKHSADAQNDLERTDIVPPLLEMERAFNR